MVCRCVERGCGGVGEKRYLDKLIGLQGGGGVQDDLAVLDVVLKRGSVDLFEWHELLWEQTMKRPK